MRFRKGAKLDPGQVTDVRGRRGGRGLAVGGGGIGVGVLVIYVLFSLLTGGGGLGQLAPLEDQQVGQGDDPGVVSEECRTGADANERQDCLIVGVVNSIAGVLGRRLPAQRRAVPVRRHGVLHRPGADGLRRRPRRRSGPSTARRDQLVYIDLGFFDELQSRFGAGAAPFAQAYVIAHEYGHHVQDLTGDLDRIGSDRQGPESRAVRAELQADCYAGVWAANAVETGLIEQLTQADINAGLDAAAAIGDDRIQEQTQGQVNPESWTHGSSEQRRRWFSRGYEEGRPAACDTFSGSI